MNIDSTAAIPHQRFLLVMLGVIFLLEISFWLLGVVPRPITVFDLQAILTIAILFATSPKLFQSAFWSPAGRLSFKAQLCFCGIIYILILKVAYFSGYLASMIFHAKK